MALVSYTPNDATGGASSLGLQGLSNGEVETRRARGLGNTAPPATGRSYRQIIVENVFTFMNMSLVGLGLTLVLIGHPMDGLVSTGVVSFNIIVSVLQEVRAKRALDHIALLTRPRARVIRDGELQEVPPEQLVLGDVLVAGPGDQIVLDGRVAGNGSMAVDESALTGESEVIPKKPGDVVFSGSFCVSGQGAYVAEQVGTKSLAGQITAGARTFRRVLTPLQRGINLVIRLVLLIVAYLEFLLVIRALLTGSDLASRVQNATVVAGLVPNGLFLMISVAYALAAVRIAKQSVLVQQGNAVESLSNVDTLCLDKTGTLTANRLRVQGLYPMSSAVSEPELGRVLGAVAASASSHNKTSAAIASAFPARPQRVLAEVPFSSARRWSAVVFDDEEAQAAEPSLHGTYVLGAMEALHAYLPDKSWDAIETQARTLARSGLRVLLIGRSLTERVEDRGDDSRPPRDLELLGLVSLSDELRPEAKEALAAFRQAGVGAKIISGDDPETVAALARQAGLGPDIGLVSGPQLDAMDERAKVAATASSVVFGRITPQQKEHLVRTLQAGGAYVAMVGDGVNDVLALKAADLSIAMQSGTQATRAVADLVLLNDSFASLVPAVAEGQRIVNGMVHILQLFLTRIAVVGVVILSALIIGEFPIALRQATLVALLSVGIPSWFLALWAQPGPQTEASIPSRVANFVVPPVLITATVALLLFYVTLMLNVIQAGSLQRPLRPGQVGLTYAAQLPVAQTSLSAFLILAGLLLVAFAQPPSPWWVAAEGLSSDKRPAVLAAVLIAAFLIILLTPPLAELFALSILGLPEIGLVAVSVLVWILLVRWAWRGRWLARFLGLDGGKASNR